MNILNRFLKPKWQHANPVVRQQAIAELDDKNPEQQKILLALCNDADPQTAQTALHKITDLCTLQSLLENPAKQALHPSLRQRIIALLTQMPSVISEEQQISFIQRCQNASILLALAKASGSGSVQQAAVRLINSEHDLTEICLQSHIPAVRLAAAEKIQSIDLLQKLNKDLRNRDKNIYRLTKDKLDAHADENKAHQEKNRLSQQIVANLESLASKTYYPQYPQKFELLQKQWSALEAPYRTPELEEKFQQASCLCNKQIQLEIDRMTQERTRQQAHAEQLAAVSLLEEAITQFNEDIQIDALDSASFNALLKTQRIRWQNAMEIQLADPRLQQRFHHSQHLLEQGLLAFQRVQAQENALLQLIENDKQTTIPQLKKALDEIQWPTALTLPASLKKIQQALNTHQLDTGNTKTEKKQQANTLSEQIQQLKQALDQGEFKTANKIYKTLQQEAQQALLQQHASLQNEFKHISMRLKDMNDWQDFSSIQKKEELCLSMEALINQAQDPESKAQHIKALQEAWQHSGISKHKNAQALWLRFKAASDQAYEPCKLYFQQQDEQRKKNLEARKHICDQLQQFITENDWAHANWKAVIEIIQTAKQQWKQHAQVDRSKGQELQQRFNELLAQLETRVKAEKEHNRNQKMALIQAMHDMIKHPDLNEAIEKTKLMQSQWKHIAALSFKEDEALWQQFRQQCDAIFARRNEVQRQAQQEKDLKIQQAQALCQQLEHALQNQKDILEHSHLDAQLTKEFDTLLLTSELEEPLRKRFNKAKMAFNATLQQARKEQRLQQLDTLHALGDWLAKLEMSDPKPAADTLLAYWQTQSAQLPAPYLAPLGERFNKLQQGVTAMALENLQKDKTLLCIRMEIAAGMDSPESDKATRMAYQVSRLSQGLGQGGEKSTPVLEQALGIESQWLGLPAHPALGSLDQRFKMAREVFWKKHLND